MSTDKYQLLSERERVLVNSTMYLGSNVRTPIQDWFVIENKLQHKELDIHYLASKMVDELLINVSDHSSTKEGAHLSLMKVTIGENYVEVTDNGGILVDIHPETGYWIPYLIFGNLGGGSKTGFDEDSTRGGQNKIGASLVNILSKRFIVKTSDGNKSYYQEFSNNMTEYTEPVISKSKHKGTTITFYPDFDAMNYDCKVKGKFNDDDIIAFNTRVYEMAFSNPQILTYLNGNKILINSSEKYISLLGHKNYVTIENNGWDLSITNSSKKNYEHISLVNSIRTHADNSTHTQYVTDKIVGIIREYLVKKYKIELSPGEIKQHLMLVLTCKISLPKFDSQVKERLTTPVSAWNKKIVFDELFEKKLIKSTFLNQIIEDIKSRTSAKEFEKLKEDTKKAVNTDTKSVPKFLDATTKIREFATLYLSEGDSAYKAVNSARNPKFDASFPLKGVVLNVRNTEVSKIMKKEGSEIFNIVSITGMKPGQKRFSKPDGIWLKAKMDKSIILINENDFYVMNRETETIRRPTTSRIIDNNVTPTHEELLVYHNMVKDEVIVRELEPGVRFGKIALAMDADMDGHKILALNISNFDVLWPSYIKEGRLYKLVTPIIRVRHNGEEIEFYTEDDFEHWFNSLSKSQQSKASILHVKGLSGHTAKQFKKFLMSRDNFKKIVYSDGDFEYINDIFSSNNAQYRKDWMTK